MNSDLPESLEDRIAPASLVNAMNPIAVEDNAAGNAMPPVEQPFFGPQRADAVGNISAATISSTSIAGGRPIMDAPASSIAPAFIDAIPGAPLGGFDVTLALRGLLESDSTRTTGIHDILSGDSVTAEQSLGLAQNAALSGLTAVAGLASPVLLVDVPKIERSL